MSHDRSTAHSHGSRMVFQVIPASEKWLSATGPDTPGATKLYHTRKPHSKSRRGCLACKSGRVKCDETKPYCQRCQSKRISCQYKSLNGEPVSNRAKLASRKGTILDLSAEIQSVPSSFWPGDKRPLVLTNSEMGSRFNSGNDLMLLHHFQSSTSHNLGSLAFDQVNDDITLKLALEHSYLMHAVLAVGATQLRRLKPQDQSVRSAEMKHWQCALSSFRTALNDPFTRDNCDAILLSSILLNIMSFSFIPGNDLSPSRSWVFSDSPQLLNWLYIQLGLRHLLEQTKPFHIESKLTPIFIESDDEQGTFSDESPGVEGLPHELVKVCGLDPSSTPENSPYHSPLRLLTPLLTLERCDSNLFKFVHWFASVEDKFALLLQEKDPPALLLLSYWLGMLCELDQWWCHERAKRECTAICMLLKHRGDRDIVRLLGYPAMACGYPL